MRTPKIPITPIVTLSTTLAYATYNSVQAKNNSDQNHSESMASNDEIKNKIERIEEKVDKSFSELKDQVDNLSERVSSLEQASSSQNIEGTNSVNVEPTNIDPINTDNIDKSSTIPSWDDIVQLFSSISDYIHSISPEKAIALTHLVLLLILIYIFILVLIVLYGNYLIDHYQIVIRYPRLKRIFEIRQKYSQLYISYLLACALFLTFFHIIIDILILIS